MAAPAWGSCVHVSCASQGAGLSRVLRSVTHVSCVMYHVFMYSCVMCHVSCTHVSCVMYSCIMCHVSMCHASCHVSCVMCHISIHHVSCVMCHVINVSYINISCIMWHVACVMHHVIHVSYINMACGMWHVFMWHVACGMYLGTNTSLQCQCRYMQESASASACRKVSKNHRAAHVS